MKKIIAAVGALAICAIAPVLPTAAHAQVAGIATCEARSPVAVGVWQSADLGYSCRRALQECAIRTPYGYTCVVTRWWVN